MAKILQFVPKFEHNPAPERPKEMADGKFYDLLPQADVNGEIYTHIQCEYQVPGSPNEYSVKGIPQGSTEVKAFILRFTPDRGVTTIESPEQNFGTNTQT